jgi:MYXO-CTERM domain-containing protein
MVTIGAPMLHAGTLKRCCWTIALSCCVLSSTTAVQAQSWSGARSTPSLAELVALDATGEARWPFGFEDVAGDGAAFENPEQSVDIRDAYAATDATRLWLRAYVSATAEPDDSLRLFVFIDADDSVASGGSADAVEIDPELTSDPTVGGYEYALALAADGSVLTLFRYDDGMATFVENAGQPMLADAEVGVDLDPLRFGMNERGYLQGTIGLTQVEVDEPCDSNLFFRALSDQGNDLDVATRVGCVPGDENGDGVPNVVEDAECDSNADCPANGVCLNGDCIYPTACDADGDCAADETCTDGRCVADGGDNCETEADCDGLVCSNGTCEPCNASGVSCSSGQVCGSDGRCVGGTPGDGEGGAAALVDEDETVKGGAFTCAVSHQNGGAAWLLALGGLALWALRRRKT